ncbi:MAG: hypothetical protein H7Y31_15030 [Chitinophagaceae bacterium]|nr:hypothetical protein [Chitinophagaceae bacterium]
MTLHVGPESILSDVQQQFQSCFPGFKLEFFFSSADNIKPSIKLHHSFPFVSIGELCSPIAPSKFVIKESMTIRELEQKFRRKFGLPARVYMRDGQYWQKKASMDKIRLSTQTEVQVPSLPIIAMHRFVAPDFSLQMGS